MSVLTELIFSQSNIDKSESCSCQLMHSHVLPPCTHTALFMICGTEFWHVDWHTQDVLSWLLLIYFLPSLLPGSCVSLATVRWQETQQLHSFRWRLGKVRPGDKVLVLSPHQRMLLNLHTHTFRFCTLTYSTLLMGYGEHNQSLLWISTPALCSRRGEENGEFMQSKSNT